MPAGRSISPPSVWGNLSPVFFGSALRNFGIRELMDAIVDWAPSPRDQQRRNAS